MFWGIFGMGVVMIQDMQLTYVVQVAATKEAATSGQGRGPSFRQRSTPRRRSASQVDGQLVWVCSRR